MKKTLSLLLAALLLAALCLGLTACGGKTLLDPNAPVTLSLWHVYGEQADSPMNLLVAEFNRTVGLEKGIVVNVTNVTGTSKLLGQLLDAKAKNPGAPDMPDLFSCHTQNAPSLGTEDLLDWSEWFSDRELDKYVPEFIESGMTDGDRLTVFPVSKSTYALYVNGSRFDRFSADTGVTYDDLSTWDGFFDAAEKYCEWSDGMPFCAFDYLIRHMELDILSRHGSLEYTEDGWYDTSDPNVKQSFTMFAEAIVKGHIAVSDLYANTQIMTGEVMCGIGSTAAIIYFNDTVTYPDNTTEPTDLRVLPLPRSGGKTEYMPQTGVGLAALKTTDQKAEAAYEFVKWFTESERNLDFVVNTGYMPVTNGAYDAIADYDFADESYRNLYSAIETMHDEYVPVVRPDFDGFYDKTDALYAGIRDSRADLTERYTSGEPLADLTDELWQLFCEVAQK